MLLSTHAIHPQNGIDRTSAVRRHRVRGVLGTFGCARVCRYHRQHPTLQSIVTATECLPESTAECFTTRNTRCEQDAEGVRAAAAAARGVSTAAAAATAVAAAPTAAGMRTLGENLVRPVASVEAEEAADGDVQYAVQDTIDSDHNAPAAERRHPSGAAAPAGPPDEPVLAEKGVNMTGGEQTLPGQGQEGAILAVKNRSGDAGGGPAVADAQAVLLGGGTGDDERRADDGSDENRDRAGAGAQ